ncbi:carboxypeptidase-like regulatory domain-containing protein [Planctomicrobium sp. SH661]|uniref:carboxypeptidase-like regulatory domain-containing protein n=1 Tax=Planctomicrobium sp. SH661 TaxID=3448124 RepID=UPI003F5B4E13
MSRLLKHPRSALHSPGKGILTAILFLGLAGCQKETIPLGEVSGRVTLDGQPVPNAFITFTPDLAGRPSTSRSNADGEYELRYNATRKGALLGSHQVRASTGDLTPDDKVIPEIIPARYHKLGSIAVVVEKGKNVIDLDLMTLPGDETARKKSK